MRKIQENPRYQDKQVKQYVQEPFRMMCSFSPIVTGMAASGQLLKNYEEALQASDNPNKQNLRPVMVHCQTVRYDQLDKMAGLSMISSIFAGWRTWDKNAEAALAQPNQPLIGDWWWTFIKTRPLSNRICSIPYGARPIVSQEWARLLDRKNVSRLWCIKSSHY